MNTSENKPAYLYDAFICYSRQDEGFAKKLEAKLERYRTPKGLGAKTRLNIFRDTQDLVGNELSESIQQALYNSRQLIVVCSPNASHSEWVGTEIEMFATHHGKANILLVLKDGRPNGDVSPEDPLQDQAFHKALYEHFNEPLALDYRSLDGDRRRERRTRHELFSAGQLVGVYDTLGFGACRFNRR